MSRLRFTRHRVTERPPGVSTVPLRAMRAGVRIPPVTPAQEGAERYCGTAGTCCPVACGACEARRDLQNRAGATRPLWAAAALPDCIQGVLSHPQQVGGSTPS